MTTKETTQYDKALREAQECAEKDKVIQENLRRARKWCAQDKTGATSVSLGWQEDGMWNSVRTSHAPQFNPVLSIQRGRRNLLCLDPSRNNDGRPSFLPNWGPHIRKLIKLHQRLGDSGFHPNHPDL